jgi:hypothetical protein
MKSRNPYLPVFYILLSFLFLMGCDNGDRSSDDSGEWHSAGSISFNTTSGSQTKGLEQSNWQAVTVPLGGGIPGNPANASSVASSSTVSSQVATSSAFSLASSFLTRGAPVTGTDAPVGSFGVLGYLLTGGAWSSSLTSSFMYNTQVTRSGSSSSYTYNYFPVKYWPDNTSDKVQFFAYYPYQGNGVTLSSATTTGYPTITYTPGTTVSSQVDLMYASSSAVNNKMTSTAVNLGFSHALTRISFSAKLDPSFTTQKVFIQSIQITGIKSSGTLSFDPSKSSSPWTIGTATSSYTASVSDGSLLPTANQALSTSAYNLMTNYTGYLLLLPQSVTTSNTVVVNYTVDGTAKTATYTLSAATWSMGQGINYQLIIPAPFTPANCYILAPSTSLTIPVGIKGNGESTSAALGNLTTTHTAASVGVVWQTTPGLVTCTNFNATSQTVTVTAGSTSGNAVIAAYDGSGNILWSWHIWVTSYNPNAGTYSYTPTTGVTNVFMDRNLGALTTTYVNDANMLHYQWGRKDPFPAATVVNASGTSTSVDVTTATTTQTMLFSSQNPLKFISGNTSPYDWCSTSSDYYWMGTGGTITTPGVKTIYDPCPAGWRVPAWRSGVSPWNGLSTTSGTWGSGTLTGYTWGSVGFWPAAGTRFYSYGALYSVGSSGYYWSASPNSGYGYSLYFDSGDVIPANDNYRALGFSVRCVQE